MSQKLNDGAVIVVDKLETADGKTKGTAEMFRRLGVSGKALVIDVKPDEKFTLSARNIAGVQLVAASRVTARDIMDTSHVIATREAIGEAAGGSGLVSSSQRPVSSTRKRRLDW